MYLQCECGFEIDARDHFDNTPLHIAAEVSFEKINSLLRPILCLIYLYIIHIHVKKRTFFNLLLCYSNHETNLLLFRKNDYLYSKLLVAFGADISVKNYQEQTPRDLAKHWSTLRATKSISRTFGQRVSINNIVTLGARIINVDELTNKIIGCLHIPERMSGLVWTYGQ